MLESLIAIDRYPLSGTLTSHQDRANQDDDVRGNHDVAPGVSETATEPATREKSAVWRRRFNKCRLLRKDHRNKVDRVGGHAHQGSLAAGVAKSLGQHDLRELVYR